MIISWKCDCWGKFLLQREDREKENKTTIWSNLELKFIDNFKTSHVTGISPRDWRFAS